MASLRSRIIDGRLAGTYLQYGDWAGRRMKEDRELLRSGQATLINAQGVYDDLIKEIDRDPAAWREPRPPYPMPPFRYQWLECMQNGYIQCGIFVRRMPFAEVRRGLNFDSPEAQRLYPNFAAKPPETMVSVDCWEWQSPFGRAALEGHIMYFLDAQGELVEPGLPEQEFSVRCYIQLPLVPIDTFDKTERLHYELYLAMQITWATHAFARLNCHNVQLVPRKSAASGEKRQPAGPPTSVWHEIVVTGMPELRRARGECPPDGEKRELRFHKVRGHYADYTKGKGLFGRWKVRIWVDEHEAGNTELGAVASSYRVE